MISTSKTNEVLICLYVYENQNIIFFKLINIFEVGNNLTEVVV